MRTPFAGDLVVAAQSGPGFDLYTLDEWGTMSPPRMRLDAQGRLLYHGRTTGYGLDILLDTGETLE